MHDEVIELSSSSPDPSPRKAVNTSRPRKSQPVTRSNSVSHKNDVIILTDSDDEDLPLAVLPITPASTRDTAWAGPSRLETPYQSGPVREGRLFSSSSKPKAGPSRLGSSVRKIPARSSPMKSIWKAEPLFLPNDDETGPPRAVPGPSREPANPFPDFEKLVPLVPSKPATAPVEANPSSSSKPKAGPSRLGSSVRKTPARASPMKSIWKAEPLFLPNDDETEPPRAIPGPSPEPVNPTPAFEKLPLVPPKPATPPVEANPIDAYLARVLEIIPDVQPDHLLALIQKHIPSCQEQTVERILHLLFEDPTYPKVDKGKRKRVDGELEGDERGKAKLKADYASWDREYKGGPSYIDLAMEQLRVDFPLIPVGHVRQTFFARNSLYAPTYLFLAEERARGILPYMPKSKPYHSKTKDKGKGKVLLDAEFENERQWLLHKLQEDTARKEEDEVKDEDEECDDGIECGCCFSTYKFEKMIQCPEAHLFCKSCMASYASNLLGAHDPNIVCMDQCGCKLPFTMAELSRFLTPKLIDLYNRVKQRKEIEAAGLENLEECPFCEYKVVIENEHERLFRCENNDCGVVSCRECKKADHLPKSCKEMEVDKHLDGRHAVEEAMTRALTRNCPKCQTAFIKELGCNKMTCPNCYTLSCYICRQIITGYDHFANTDPPLPGKCNLSDPVERRHNEDVAAAAKKALEDYKRDHPDVTEKDIKVDLPPPLPPPAIPHAYPNMAAQYMAAMPYAQFPVPMPPLNFNLNAALLPMPAQPPRRPRARVARAPRAPRRR